MPDDSLDVAPTIASHVVADLAARGPQRGRVNRVEEATDKSIIWNVEVEKAGKEAQVHRASVRQQQQMATRLNISDDAMEDPPDI